MKIGFIGLGNMGMPMALNLHKSKRIDLLGYDVRFSDVIITCVPGPKQIKALSIGKGKIIDQLGNNKIWIDCSTNSLTCFNLLKQKLSKKINQFVDATISGGNLKAQSGDLSIFIGGNKKTVNKLKFVFNILGKNIYYLNKPGAGYAAKIAQVSLCYLNYLSLSESLMLGVKSGSPNMINGDYDPSFFLGLSMKDLNLANEIIKLQKLKLPIMNLTSKIYNKAIKQYGPNSNHLKVIKLLEQNNKLTFSKEGR